MTTRGMARLPWMRGLHAYTFLARAAIACLVQFSACVGGVAIAPPKPARATLQ